MQSTVVLLLVAVVAAAQAQTAPRYLDQVTDSLNGAVRELRSNGAWQSYAATWSAQLVAVDFYMGSAAGTPCQAFRGDLLIMRQKPSTSQASVIEAITPLEEVHRQEVVTSCNADGDSVSWQSFALASPVSVAAGEHITIALIGLVGQTTAANAWMGVSPASANLGGASSLLVSPLYPTKYAHYTFRTWMDRPPPAGTSLSDLQGTEDGQLGRGSSGGDAGSSSGSSVSVAGIAAGVALVALVAVAVLAVVRMRSSNKDKYTVNPDASTSSSRKQPLAVRPARTSGWADSDVGADLDDAQLAGGDTWADSVAALPTDAAAWSSSRPYGRPRAPAFVGAESSFAEDNAEEEEEAGEVLTPAAGLRLGSRSQSPRTEELLPGALLEESF